VRLASSAASRAASDLGLAPFALRDIRIDQYKAAAWHRVVADLDHSTIGAGALEGVTLVYIFGIAA